MWRVANIDRNTATLFFSMEKKVENCVACDIKKYVMHVSREGI